MTDVGLTNTEIKNKFNELWEDSKISPQKRGFAFEKLLKAKLENEQLEPRSGYRPTAEQIDGSFFWEGRTFLIEAKWEKNKLPASSLYAFQGKLNGKFHTTSGVFIAVNGYSADVEEGLKVGKPLNMVLFDGSDIQLIFNDEVSFLQVLKFKLRQAGDTGSLNVPYEITEDIQNIVEADLNFMFLDDLAEFNHQDDFYADFLVFVEGASDVKLVHALLNSKNDGRQLSYKIIVLEGVDKIRELPALINQYISEYSTSAALIVLDQDIYDELKMIIETTLENLENSSIYINTKFLSISKSVKNILERLNKKISAKDQNLLEKTALYDELQKFIQNIIDVTYFDPATDLPYENFQGTMNEATFDYKNSEISFDHYSGTPLIITDIEGLVDHLNEEVISAMVEKAVKLTTLFQHKVTTDFGSN
ncbi:hypothetical protein HNP37_003513 [Flavobacterium nitrogenifigens]|uniref:Restriction endonuclease type IV Mrr domain-containing protein n=2 Tax=Flavobacterium TaxID=237 RepID=A0A7W7IZK9_9FLAO|nr:MULTISPECIES: restriction endonuclease [Flavobacterium]MBB4803438.1 hypothetical protein [Flavobacterium nitrogenifigens]MBB6388396.1 hypothetical protein [Flavobacterium notoginsengisoli]